MASNTDGSEEVSKQRSGPNPFTLMIASIVALAVGGAGAFIAAPAPGTLSETKVGIQAKEVKGGVFSHSETDKNNHDSMNSGKISHKNKSKKASKKKLKSNHPKSGKHGDKKGEAPFSGARIIHSESSAYVELPPILVSVKSVRSARHLKVRVVIETNSTDADVILTRVYHIQDLLNTYLRSVDPKQFESPAYISMLKQKLLHRIRLLSPAVEIENVLVTEFLLT